MRRRKELHNFVVQDFALSKVVPYLRVDLRPPLAELTGEEVADRLGGNQRAHARLCALGPNVPARAKGAPERVVLVKHAIRNALLPMITVAGLQFPTLLSGALVTETVFTWPGMGRLFLDSLSYRDYPVVMGILILSAVLVLIGNMLADILYAVADPRIRLD